MGKLQSTLSGHSNYVMSVAWSMDGTLASGSADNSVKIWVMDSSNKLKLQSTLSGHNGAVTQVEFSDAGTLVSASEDGTTRFWDVATGAQKEEMQGEKFTFSKGPSDQQTAGKYVVTKQGDLLLVHLIDTVIASANLDTRVRRRQDCGGLPKRRGAAPAGGVLAWLTISPNYFAEL